MKKHVKLGQNFLIDDEIISKIISLSDIHIHDIVYEVGTGKGVLTAELCKISKYVYSFEIDNNLYLQSKKILHYDNLTLLNQDGLKHDSNIEFDIFFSSLPYYESKNALFWLLQKKFRKGIIVLQREFVEKLMSPPGQKNYRSVSVLSQYRFLIKPLANISRFSFHPVPNVDSVIIEIFPKMPPLSKEVIDQTQFLFSFRKKNISFISNHFKKHHNYSIDTQKFGSIGTKKLFELPINTIIDICSSLDLSPITGDH